MKKRTSNAKGKIDKSVLQCCVQDFNTNPRYQIAQNAVTQTEPKQAMIDWGHFSTINHSFSHKISTELKATDQQASGRCWLFACLNLLRLNVAKRHQLKVFELSQSYLFFWDQFEKANFFLENIIQTADEPSDERLVSYLFSKPIEDGGQWHMFASLVEKYGVVPQSVYPESISSSKTAQLSFILATKLRDYAVALRQQARKKAINLQAVKQNMLIEVYRILSIHLGAPPTTFNWSFHNKAKKYHAYAGLTPKSFLKKHAFIDFDNYVCLVNSPRKSTPYYQLFGINYLGNVFEGREVRYINVPISDLKRATIKSLKKDRAVWFGCDTGKCHHTQLGVMDTELFNDRLLYNVTFDLDKAERMQYGASYMTHAMLFTGVNIEKNNATKWRVENSWGHERGDKGYYLMTDAWFDEYMFEVVVEKQFLTKKILDVASGKVKMLPPWDPLGSLAQK